MSRIEHTQNVLNLLGKASVPGSERLKSYWFIMKRTHTVTRHSMAEFYHWKRKRKKMIYCFWPHPWSAENIMSKVASAFLHLTETNPQEGISGPPSLCGGCKLSSCLCGSPLGAPFSPHGPSWVDWRLSVPQMYEWECVFLYKGTHVSSWWKLSNVETKHTALIAATVGCA